MIVTLSTPVLSGKESLITDVFLPDSFSGIVLLIRTPYDRTKYHAQVSGWLASGFGLVVQDVRGRYSSTGVWEPYSYERVDGKATLRWLEQQEWCTGVIPMGASYEAATAFAVAAEDKGGSFVKGLISKVPTLGLGSVKVDPSGILRLQEHAVWWLAHGGRRTSSFDLPDLYLANDPTFLSVVPVSELMTKTGLPQTAVAGFSKAIEIARDGKRHKDDVIAEDELSALNIPTLHIGGWQDLQLGETIRHYDLVGSAYADRPARSLVVGDWGHDLGIGAGDKKGVSAQLDWLERLGTGTISDDVRIFDRSQAKWLYSADLEGTISNKVMYLCNDGRLSDCAPTSPLKVKTRYRPSDVRVRSQKACWCWQGSENREAFLLNGRPQLRIVTEPLQEPFDWICRLFHIRDDSKVKISEGAATSNIGQQHVAIQLLPTVFSVLPGDQIQVQLMHDDFPILTPQIHERNDRYLTKNISSETWESCLSAGILRLPAMEAR